jgi:hypothetical protein
MTTLIISAAILIFAAVLAAVIIFSKLGKKSGSTATSASTPSPPPIPASASPAIPTTKTSGWIWAVIVVLAVSTAGLAVYSYRDSKREMVAHLYFDGVRGSIYNKGLKLEKGDYLVDPDTQGTKILYEDDKENKHKEVRNGRFSLPSPQTIHIISIHPEISIYKKKK